MPRCLETQALGFPRRPSAETSTAGGMPDPDCLKVPTWPREFAFLRHGLGRGRDQMACRGIAHLGPAHSPRQRGAGIGGVVAFETTTTFSGGARGSGFGIGDQPQLRSAVGEEPQGEHGWSGDVAMYASHIEHYMMLVPSGEVNPEGLPVQLRQATEPFEGVDVNALYVPSWGPNGRCAHCLSSIQQPRGELPWTPPHRTLGNQACVGQGRRCGRRVGLVLGVLRMRCSCTPAPRFNAAHAFA